MNRRNLIVVAISAVLSSCSTISAVGQIDQLGRVRRDLEALLPDSYLAIIDADLKFLDHTFAEAERVLRRDPDATVGDLVLLILGAPAAFNMVGEAYDNIHSAVTLYESENARVVIPASIVTFHKSVKPAYSELKQAVATNSKLRKGVEVVTMLRPIVAMAL